MALVKQPFEAGADLDMAALATLVPMAVRMLDNAIDVSRFPLEAQRQEAMAKRRIGLGITGLADALIACGLRYGSAEAVKATERWLAAFRREAYLASRSEEHTSELQSLMRISYAVFCLKKKNRQHTTTYVL